MRRPERGGPGALEPCTTCPFRRSSTVGGAEIPGFSLGLMRRLVDTVGDGTDSFRPIMACHYSPEGGRDRCSTRQIPCRGYLARHGYSNINVRLMAAREGLPLAEIVEACEQLDLWPDFATMLAAYEEAATP